MGARRLLLGVLVSMCASCCALGIDAGLAQAGGGTILFGGTTGSAAGQIQGFAGMAVDGQSGDIYIADSSLNRINKFDRSGKFLLAWGWGVNSSAEKFNEFQVCTSATGCGPGEGGSGVGQFAPQALGAVAVDNQPGPSHGDVYVVDFSNYRVQVFDAEGKFLRMFGGHVNENGANPNVCVAGEECGQGTQGEGDGEFHWTRGDNIAVGPGGDVYVGDEARVQVFEPSGVWKENISLSALSAEGKVTALAVGTTGDVFVKDQGVPGVHEFEPDGLEMLTKFDEGNESIQSIALDASDDLFIFEAEVEVPNCTTTRCEFVEYGHSGEEIANFGSQGTLSKLTPFVTFDPGLGGLLLYGGPTYDVAYVWEFEPPSPGPLVESESQKATAEPKGAATLEGLVDPEGNATEVKFEYVDEAHFKVSGYTEATSTSPMALSGSAFSYEHVEAHLPEGTLIPGETYHWRVVAHNTKGTNPGLDQGFQEVPAAYVDGPWSASVTATSVTLSAKIDPLGANTSYRLEYGVNSSYGHVFTGNVGEGTEYVALGYAIQELEPNTTYHYRVVTDSSVGVVEGTDRTFTTQLAGRSLALPDGRAWELVSPADKGGALIEDIERSQAASDGSGIVYSASEPIGEGIVGHVGNNATAIAGATELSVRGAEGWKTHDISPKQTLVPEGDPAFNMFRAAEAFMTFSPDLSLGVLEPRLDLGRTQQSAQATEASLYVRNDETETYEPLVTPEDVPPGTKWSPGNQTALNGEEMPFLTATPDLSHILFDDRFALTPEAVSEPSPNGTGNKQNLYEWSEGHLELVNIVPNEKTMREEPKAGAIFGSNVFSASSEGQSQAANPWGMSSDGRWIVFRYYDAGGSVGDQWYVRDMVNHKTVPFGTPGESTRFETMSRDGSRIFYLGSDESTGQVEEGDLYMFSPATGATTDLTANHQNGESSARVQSMLLGTSEDGSYVYFVAKSVLASGAVSGQNNLYVLHEDNGKWQTEFIAELSSEDGKDWSSAKETLELQNITSRVSPNGRYLTFMSDRSLTGYDNVDAISGQPDEEVYLYDAVAKRLVCASCDPSGARPTGVYDDQIGEVLMDQSGAWAITSTKEGDHWLAGSIAPNWHVNWDAATHRPSYLSDEGRLFFDSSDALVAQDTNGLADVYEYEPSGVGDCSSGSAAFSVSSAGCVGLISSGQSASESTFLDASENGDDVFFITANKLVSEDKDTVNDVYDAHVCSQAVPCRAEPVSPPVCSSGDSCKPAPAPQPTIFGPAPSATFKGAGNVLATAPVSSAKSKSSTRVQKLTQALKECRKRFSGKSRASRKKRVTCERQARRRYPAKRSRSVKMTAKGER